MLVAPPPPADPKTAKVVKRLSAPKKEQIVVSPSGTNALYGTPPDPALVSQPVGGAYYNDTLAPVALSGGDNSAGAPIPFIPPVASDQIDQAAGIIPPPAAQVVGDASAQGNSVAPTIDNNDLLSRAIGVAGVPTPVEGQAPTAPTFLPPPARNDHAEKQAQRHALLAGAIALGLTAFLHGGPAALGGVLRGTAQGLGNIHQGAEQDFQQQLQDNQQKNAQAQQTFGNQEKTYGNAVANARYTDAQHQQMVDNITAQIKAVQDGGKTHDQIVLSMLKAFPGLDKAGQEAYAKILGEEGIPLPTGIKTNKDLTAEGRLGVSQQNANERGRADRAKEGIQQGTLDERIRNNKVLSGIHQQVADTTQYMATARASHMNDTVGLARAALQARITGNPLALQRLQVAGAQQQRMLRKEQESYGVQAANIQLQISKLHATPTGDDEADKDTLSKLTDAYYQAKQNIEYSKQEQEQLAQQLAPPITVPPGAGAVSNNGNLPSVGPIGIPPPLNGNASFFTNAGPIGDNTVTTSPGTPTPKKIKVPPAGKNAVKKTVLSGVKGKYTGGDYAVR